ncbi:MAG: endonuclease VII domain-containing protein [Actinomycetota bacterium]|nr:endonuclease VII domain-containing protein [Actinomycetota bacterium]
MQSICKDCHREYKRTRAREPASEGFKDCAGGCGRRLHVSFFSPDRQNFDGRMKSCKICVKLRRYLPMGLTYAVYDAMLRAQDYRCAVCMLPLPENTMEIHVDHCHGTNRVRGILCRGCNMGLGGFRESVDALSYAIEYLRRHAPEEEEYGLSSPTSLGCDET